MSRRTRRALWLAIPAVLLAGYTLWCNSGRQAPAGRNDPPASVARIGGAAEGQGNLVAIQPRMIPADYHSAGRFAAKMEGYFAQARMEGMLHERTVVLLPEYVGTWLVVLGEKQSVLTAPTITRALSTMVLSNPLAMARALCATRAPDRLRAALFQMKAREMAAVYQGTFSSLAARYHVTILAGSIVLPAPSVRDGVLTAGAGPLQNVAVLYLPDGRADAQLVRKVDLTREEQRFLVPGATRDLPVISTPAGRLGVLLCADAWFPENYRQLRALGAQIIVVPSFITGDGKLATRWQGYDGAPAPADVAATDVQRLTQGQAWARYALLGRLPTAGAPLGIHVCLRGHLWNLGSDGVTTVARGKTSFTAPAGDDACIIDVSSDVNF